jgi:2-oxoglutarate dehydrogenase E2 component (dihydrolipoamide succinyltransferase)
MSTQIVKVPSVGESITEVTIGLWKKTEGDAVATDEPLVEVESEKATMEVPAPVTGVLRRILRAQGESARVGEIIAEIEEGAVSSAKAVVSRPPVPGAPTAPEVATAVAVPDQPRPTNGRPHEPVKASPSVRRLMAEKEIGAADVEATGPAGRIEREDVLRAESQRHEQRRAPAPPPPAPSTQAAPRDPADVPARRQGTGAPRGRADLERVVPMTPLRKTVARRLLEAQQNAAILTTFNEVNMHAVMALREKYKDVFLQRHGIKLGFMSFFVKAVVEALKAFPLVNAEVRGSDIVYKDYFDIGVAVGGGRGLVVPVVRDANRLSLAEIEKAVAELAGRAKDNKLTLEELAGGTFTISNGGVYGSMLSTPILNPPQSAILGMHAIQKRAVVIGDEIAIRPMMFLALSYDHRIVDGREAVQFLVRVKECIEDPERLLIEV